MPNAISPGAYNFSLQPTAPLAGFAYASPASVAAAELGTVRRVLCLFWVSVSRWDFPRLTN